MVRGRAIGALIGAAAVAALGASALAPADASATDQSYRSPHCSPIRPQTADAVFRGGAYRLVVLERSWLRVGRRLGIGQGPPIDPGFCQTPLCVPSSTGPPECTYVGGRPQVPGPRFAVYKLLAFPRTLALSHSGSSRVILVAEYTCRQTSSERALLRCLRSL
jgi:hypothetical protein